MRLSHVEPFLHGKRLSIVNLTRSIFVIVALCTTATAQTTWHNLRFGASRDEVRSALAAQSFPVETSAEGSLQSVSNYQLLLPGMRYALPLRADFHFTDAGGLMNVVLSLDVIAMKQNFSNVGGDEALMLFAADKLNRALNDKYGPPLDIQADCAADAATLAKRPVTCAVNWHDPGQSVELNWITRVPRLYIRYQMLAPDL
jgi:hypothetical protein